MPQQLDEGGTGDQPLAALERRGTESSVALKLGVPISVPRLAAQIKADAHTAGERLCEVADDGAAVASR